MAGSPETSLPSVAPEGALADRARRRPTRPPDFAAEHHALIGLIEAIAEAPQGILKKLAEAALDACRAGSAGVSLLEAGGTHFRWRAVAGPLAPHLGRTVQRHESPSGAALDRNRAVRV